MELKNFLLNLSLSTLTVLAISEARAAKWNREVYSQNVYLHKYGNPISQNYISAGVSLDKVDVYGGVWIDQDRKTDDVNVYTDAQISPLLGMRSKAVGNKWMFHRAFGEARLVHRTEEFPDDRARTTYELRGGVLGYGLVRFDSPFFIENYYAWFYTRLYGERGIFQGWARQGLSFWKHLEVFNEFFADTFDQTREADPTYDWRPSVRLRFDQNWGTVQLMYQRLYHFSNLNYSGCDEDRTVLVFSYAW